MQDRETIVFITGSAAIYSEQMLTDSQIHCLSVTAATGVRNQRHESVSYWWSCISLFVHGLGVKCVRCPIIHFSTWKLKQNKCTRKCSKRGNTPRKWWFKLNQFRRIHVLTSFCLASDLQRKTSVSHASRFEKGRIRAGQCSSWKSLVREAKFNQKTIPAETQTLTLTLESVRMLIGLTREIWVYAV